MTTEKGSESPLLLDQERSSRGTWGAGMLHLPAEVCLLLPQQPFCDAQRLPQTCLAGCVEVASKYLTIFLLLLLTFTVTMTTHPDRG